MLEHEREPALFEIADQRRGQLERDFKTEAEKFAFERSRPDIGIARRDHDLDHAPMGEVETDFDDNVFGDGPAGSRDGFGQCRDYLGDQFECSLGEARKGAGARSALLCQPACGGGRKRADPPQHGQKSIHAGKVRRSRRVDLRYFDFVDQRQQPPRLLVDDVRGEQGEIDGVGLDHIQSEEFRQ
ncbi:hypothetical protein [Bradyrhizobium japonicum]|uniref:hypothetical protein n=1 Tax=Bradyrhizobium japonicum TaxID=375 RepID=UPI00200FFD61|nr:hypothetical protein [Bradyrhizobium japonicum]UQE03401.1 hypothetical protein JEY30_48875 [Bradyrhizobium japonicum]